MVKISTKLFLPGLILFGFPSSLFPFQAGIEINQAAIDKLIVFPRVGEKRAKTIIHSRIQESFFHSPDDLIKKNIISPKILKIRSSIKVDKSRTKDQKSKLFKSIKGEITLLTNQQFQRSLFNQIQQAKKSIWIAMFLFKTTKNPNNLANRLVNLLITARERGVKILVLLERSSFSPSINKENSHTARKLKKGKIRVQMDTPKIQTHTKMIIIDDQWTLIGSHNLSHSAMVLNNETSILVNSQAFAKQAKQYFQQIQ